MTVNSTIPTRPAEVTAEWLSAVLGEAVAAVDITPVGTGQTGATYRLVVDYAGTTTLPPSFVVKLPSQDESVRARVSLGYRAEHAFYAEVADTLSIPLPTCYHCDIAGDGAEFILLLDDMAPAQQGDQLLGCTVAEAGLAVDALAGLHGPRWCDPAWNEFTGATMPRPDADFARGMGQLARTAADTTIDALRAHLSREDQDLLVEAAERVAPWLMLQPDRYALLHGDYRADNLLFDPTRETVTVVDWQTLTVGLPARDLAYFLGTSLTPDARHTHQRELVARYHAGLLTHGVTDYTAESCWTDYRIGMMQIPLITTLGFAFSAATDRGDDMVLAMLTRGCRAIRELDTLELVRRAP